MSKNFRTISVYFAELEYGYNSFSFLQPQDEAERVLARHSLETSGSQYPAPQHVVRKVDSHTIAVTFTYPDGSQKSYDGKKWY